MVLVPKKTFQELVVGWAGRAADLILCLGGLVCCPSFFRPSLFARSVPFAFNFFSFWLWPAGPGPATARRSIHLCWGARRVAGPAGGLMKSKKFCFERNDCKMKGFGFKKNCFGKWWLFGWPAGLAWWLAGWPAATRQAAGDS